MKMTPNQIAAFVARPETLALAQSFLSEFAEFARAR
jgi:hypothetical protein